MRIQFAHLLLVALLGSTAFAETNTPFPAGTRVSVTTSAGTVTGMLQDVDAPEWIAVREPGAAEISYIQLVGAIVRAAEPRAEAPDSPLFGVRPFAPLGVAPHRERIGDIEAAFDAPSMADLEADAAAAHYIYGRPEPTDDRFRFTPEGSDEEVEGITYHIREAFTLGHYNRMKVPAWVAMRWTTDDYWQSEEVVLGRPTPKKDPELPPYAQTGPDYDHDSTGMDKGHMAKDADLEAWGEDAVAEGVLMSNMVPQLQFHNHKVWTKLENQHRNIVKDPGVTGISTVWILSGPYFGDENDDGMINDADVERIGEDEVAVPAGTYKVIGWEDNEEGFHVRGYMIAQDDTDMDLTEYLVTVRDIEEATGLDFFPGLDAAVSSAIETEEHTTLWSD